MKSSIKWVVTICFITHFYESKFFVCPQKLVKCHRVHKQGMDSSYAKSGQFLEREFKERPRCHHMQFGIIFFKKTQSHNSLWAFLNFIKKQKCVAFFDRNINL